jgi:ATP-dependent Clp protease protease subunit
MKTKNKAMLFVILALALCFFPLNGLIGNNKDSDPIVLSKNNIIVLNTEVNGESVSSVISQARALQTASFQKDKPLYLFLNTPGGDIQTGLELIEALKGMKRPTNTVILFAASMGFQIAQNLGERLIVRNGVLMSHRASGQFTGSFGGKPGSQMDKRYGFWLSRLQELDEQTVKRTKGKQTLKSYQDSYADELWLTGQQAIDGGYADRIVNVRCDHDLSGTTIHSVSFMGLKLAYELDNCPLNTSPMNIKVLVPEDKQQLYTQKQIDEIKERFLEHYLDKQHSAIPMKW